MKNLYWLSIAFGLVVSGFFLADRRFTEVGLIGALICAGLTLGLGFWWFRPRPMWQGILWGALAQPVVVSLNDQMVGISDKLGLTHLYAAFYSPLPEETIKLLGVVIIIAAFGNVKHPYQAAAIGMAVGLDALEDCLAVVEDSGGRIHAERRVGAHLRVVPTLVLGPVNRHHVVGEVLTKAGVRQNLLQALWGGGVVSSRHGVIQHASQRTPQTPIEVQKCPNELTQGEAVKQSTYG